MWQKTVKKSPMEFDATSHPSLALRTRGTAGSDSPLGGAIHRMEHFAALTSQQTGTVQRTTDDESVSPASTPGNPAGTPVNSSTPAAVGGLDLPFGPLPDPAVPLHRTMQPHHHHAFHTLDENLIRPSQISGEPEERLQTKRDKDCR